MILLRSHDNGDMRSGSSPINLFQYLDYRRFLKDWFTESKKMRRGLSFRSFAKKAGFKSVNFFKFVMDGKRNLTEESLVKCMSGLGLNKQEQDFFRNLVSFNQAKTHEVKDTSYQRLIRSRKYNQLKPIAKEQYEYFAAWYHPVVRELIVSRDCNGTPQWVASRIFPPITPIQVTRSIELLEKIGLIEKGLDGRWKQSNSLVSTGPEVLSVSVLNYHKLVLDLAKETLETVPMSRRDVSALTLGVLKERIPELKRRIQEFREEILKLVAGDSRPEEVIQLNIQMFPVTRPAEPENEVQHHE